MNIALVIGAYAALCRVEGAAFRLLGPAHVYEGVFAQVTDSHALGRASLWAATSDAARGEAFNDVHQPFRWRRVWNKLNAALDLPLRPPVPIRMATHMADKKAAWEWLDVEQGLSDLPYERAIGWGFGDFVFHSDFDLVFDTGKIWRAGSGESVAALVRAIRSLQEAKVLPRWSL